MNTLRLPAQKQRLLSRRDHLEGLERRMLLSATLVSSVADVNITSVSTPTVVDLYPHFSNPNPDGTLPSSVAFFDTTLGGFNVVLNDQQTPKTVANFAHYIAFSAYNNTIIHRSADLNDQTGSKTLPATIIQGGGFSEADLKNHISAFAPVVNEFSLPNVRGTIAMAKTSDPNSATSEWFFNVQSNPGLNDPANSGGFTVFGTTDSTGLAVIDAIANLQRFDRTQSTGNSALTDVPQQNGNDIIVKSVTISPKLNFTATSDNSGITASVSGDALSLHVAPGAKGPAHITVLAQAPDGTSVQSTFTVTVPASVALNANGVKLVTFTETDGTIGRISARGGIATVTVTGDNTTYTDVAGIVTVTGSNLRLSAIDLTTSSIASSISISGRGGADKLLDIGNVTVTGALGTFSAATGKLRGELRVSGLTRSIVLGYMDGGQISLNSDATSTPLQRVAMSLGKVVNSGVGSNQPIGSLRVASWTSTDSATHTLGGPALFALASYGDFTPNVNLGGGLGVGVVHGTIGNSSWTLGGSLVKLTVGTTGANFSASVNGEIGYLATQGNLSGSIQAAVINTIKVGGAMVGPGGGNQNVIQTTGAFDARALQFNRLQVRGAISDTIMYIPGNFGTLSALSMTNSQLYAGVALKPAQDRAFPTAAADFTSPAVILKVRLAGRVTNFSSSIIAAKSIQSATLGSINTNNTATAFGLAGQSITGVLASVGTKRLHLTKANLLSEAKITAAFSSQGIIPGDFSIKII